MTDTEIFAKVQHAMKEGETLDAFLKRSGIQRHEVDLLTEREITRYAQLSDAYHSEIDCRRGFAEIFGTHGVAIR